MVAQYPGRIGEYPSIPGEKGGGILFNNREIAAAIWLLPLMIWLLSRAEIRASAAAAIRAVLAWKILVVLAAMTLYSAALILGLYAVGFWQAGMIKDTLVWFLATLVMVMHFIASYENKNILREVFIDNVKLIVVVEFLMDTYVLPLPAELVIFPVVTGATVMLAVAQSDKKNAPAARVLTVVLGGVSLFVVVFVISRAIGDFRNLGTMGTARSIAFPPLMSILLVPFVYSLLCVLKYEELFARLGMGREKPPAVVHYARRSIVFHCGLSLRRLRELRSRPHEIMQIESNEGVDRLMRTRESHGSK